LNVNKCEINRVAKLGDNFVEFIEILAPRKGEGVFYEDLYPEAASGEPALHSEEWFAGKNADVKRISLKYKSDNK